MNRLSIKSVNVILSHDDYDHCGALVSLIEKFNVGNVYQKKEEKFVFENLDVYTLLSDEEFDDNNDNSLISYFKINQFYFLYWEISQKKLNTGWLKNMIIYRLMF